jgi:hypothetical protein
MTNIKEDNQEKYPRDTFVRKTFEQLGKEKAGCVEYAMNGYIRIYEEGEKLCECKDCALVRKFPIFPL